MLLTHRNQFFFGLHKIFFLLSIIACCYTSHSQVCTLNQFVKSYLFPGSGTGYFFDRLPNGQYYFGGYYENLIIHKSDIDGNLLWSKTYDATPTIYLDSRQLAAVDSNGNYFINTDTDYVGLLDGDGNPIVAKHLKISSQKVTGIDMAVLPSNNKILLVDDQSAYGVDGYMLVCLSPDLATIIWNKYISFPSGIFWNITTVGNKIFLTGQNQMKGTILCFDSNSGNLLLNKTFDVGGTRTIIDEIYPYDDGYIIQGKNLDALNGTFKHIIIRTDQNLEILNIYGLPEIPGDASLTLCVEAGGNFYGAWGTILAYRLFHINLQDEILFHDLHMGGERPVKLVNTPEGLTLFSGNSWYAVGVGPFTALYFTRADGNGNLPNCTTYPYLLTKTAVNYIPGVSSVTVANTSMITLLPATITAINKTPQVGQSCSFTSVCDTIAILGNTNLCNNGDAIFTAQRNTGCLAPVNWTLLGGVADKQKLNDSTLSVHFYQSGTYTLIAELATCLQFRDTIEINVTVAAQVLNLGPDTTICTGNSVLLNAHRGFTSYLWQDGSTDSVYHVTQSGIYHVIVTDACGNIWRDTVSVTPHPAIAFDIGPDRTKCNNDTLHLSATPGFLNYSWSPSYNISQVSSPSVTVNPAIDTFYTAKAEKTPGCFAYDTVYITVLTSPSISLGPDRYLCAGDSAIFDAGNQFSNYKWNNGSTASRITVHTAGSYNIDASTLDGCHSYDTVAILNVFLNPIVSLDPNPAICIGSNRVLDAGDYSSYEWSTGDNGKTITVNNPGVYSVIVTDNNGCRGHDTAFITTLLPIPYRFLPVDTVVCSYGSIDILLNGYRSYLWSNNSISPGIRISQPGTYWLQVTDNNNCTGKDTILVSLKDCMTGFYMPNAFSPNRDDKNDLLRPLLFGNVKKYVFTVYNRWGQAIFHTTNLSDGWDGRVSGKPTDSNVFVWTCSYQFEGEKQNTAKGTVVLIR